MAKKAWLTVFLSPEEKAAVVRAAARDRRAMSQWARLVLLERAKEPVA